MNDAVWRFARDLSDAGVGVRRRAVLALLYERALTAQSDAAWARLYRTLFYALRLISPALPVPAVRSPAAVESLLRVVEDDLGSTLFGARALNRLRASLGNYAYASTSEGAVPT